MYAIDPTSNVVFTLTAQQLPPETFVVSRFSLKEALSTLYELDIELASADPAIDFNNLLDEDVTLRVDVAGQPQRYVHGFVTRFEQGDTGKNQTLYRMVVRPLLYRLTLGFNSRIFQEKNIEIILRALLDHWQIPYQFNFRHPHPNREFCVQFQESDYQFFARLCSEEGIYFYFEANEGECRLIITDDVSGQSAGVTLPYNTSSDSQSTTLCINSFRKVQQIGFATAVTKDYTFKNPSWPGLFEEEGEDLQNQYVTYEYFDYPGRFKKDGAGQRFTRFLIDSLRNNTHGSEGRSNSFALQPGKLFTLANHPQESFNTQWQLVSIVHSGVQPGVLESGSSGGGTSLSNHFVFIPASQNWRPRPMPKPVVPGPQTAVVVGPATEEIWTDKYGRCSLQFQWDREGQWNDWSSCWIRVSQGWAGAGWGMVALPRIGQEVIVDFLNGDPDQPVVTGRLYNDDNMPSLDLPMKKTQMTLRSKTHKGTGFNELRFEDEQNQEEIYIHAQKDQNIHINHNESTFVGNNRQEQVEVDESIEIGHDRREDVGNDEEVHIGQDRRCHIGQDNFLEVGRNQTIYIEKDRLEEVGNHRTDKTAANHRIETGGHFFHRVEEYHEIDAAQAIRRLTRTYQLEAEERIVLTAPGGKITLDAAGITLEGSAINFTNGSHDVTALVGNPFSGIPSDHYKQQILLTKRDRVTPLPNYRYQITRADGQVIEGVSDSEGRTELIEADQQESLEIVLLGPADEQ